MARVARTPLAVRDERTSTINAWAGGAALARSHFRLAVSLPATQMRLAR